MTELITYPPGQWVKFQVVVFIESNHIVLPDMIGVVLDHPHSHLICSPGVSTMIKIVGSDFEYGYANEWFIPLEHAPSEKELSEQVQYWNQSFEIYEEHFDYSGYVKIGQKVLPQEKLYQEILQNLKRMRGWLKKEGNEKHIRGNLKRMKKILNGFLKHPEGIHAKLLAAKIHNSIEDPNTYADLANYIEDWVTVAQNTYQQLETQSDRITQAKKEGRSVTIPFKY